MIPIGPESAISADPNQHSAISDSLSRRIPVRVSVVSATPCFEKRVVTLAALAARSAMTNTVQSDALTSRGLHARQRQLERHAKRDAARDDLRLAGEPRRARRSAAGVRGRATSASAIADRKAGVASGNGLWASVPSTSRSMPAAAQYTPPFRAGRRFGRADTRPRRACGSRADVLRSPSGPAGTRRACRRSARPAARVRSRSGAAASSARTAACSAASQARPTLT